MFQVGFLICDPLVSKPDLMKDRFWNLSIPQQLPYTKAAKLFQKDEYRGSAEVHLKLKQSDTIYSDMSLYGKSEKISIDSESSTDDEVEMEIGLIARVLTLFLVELDFPHKKSHFST